MDIEVILLTSIVATLFVVFGIAVYREFNVMETTEYKYTKEGGPRAGLVDLVEKLTKDKRLPKAQKEIIYNAMHRNIADMESDGIYFDVDVKEALREQKKELYCEYSGLPSVKAYEDVKKGK
jgi:hypothetical protein